MLRFFQTYHFFVLCLFLGVPAWWLVLQHPQHRKQTAWIAVFVLPFGFTERFFVPEYWNPVFMGPFFKWFGAGIEDVLFVIHLAWITAYSPLIIFRRDWREDQIPWDMKGFFRVVGLILSALGTFGAANSLGLNPWVSAGSGMLLGMALIVCLQPQLFGDVSRGLLAGGTIYFLICLIYGTVYPKDFTVIWRTAGLSRRSLLGVPLEEVVYGVLAGGIGGSFIPFLQGAPTRPRSLRGLSSPQHRHPD